MRTHTPLLLAAAALLPGTALSAPATGITCRTGYHIIVARAGGELPGEGSTGTIADKITARVPDSDSVGLNYPALTIFYNQSESAGVKQLRSDISAYVQACPKAKIVLLGYDQGANVVGDVLGGQGAEASFPIQGADAEAVKGVILLSDPSYIPYQVYDAGTATTHGIYPRSQASQNNLLRYNFVTKSYCDAGDTVCASGSNSNVNRGYLDKYADAAADFIVGLYH